MELKSQTNHSVPIYSFSHFPPNEYKSSAVIKAISPSLPTAQSGNKIFI